MLKHTNVFVQVSLMGDRGASAGLHCRPHWLVYWLSTFLLFNYFFVAKEKGKWRHILICSKAVEHPFPLTNSEFHLLHVMNGNNLPVDNNFVMEWTSFLTACPEYLVLLERVINSNRSTPEGGLGTFFGGLKASEGFSFSVPFGAENKRSRSLIASGTINKL